MLLRLVPPELQLPFLVDGCCRIHAGPHLHRSLLNVSGHYSLELTQLTLLAGECVILGNDTDRPIRIRELFDVLVEEVLLHTLLEIPAHGLRQRSNTHLIFTHAHVLNLHFHFCVQLHRFQKICIAHKNLVLGDSTQPFLVGREFSDLIDESVVQPYVPVQAEQFAVFHDA